MDKFSELKAAASALKNMSDRKEKGLRTSPLQINAAAAKMRGMLTADAVLELLAERDADKKRIAELEAKLATPVQLQNCDFESVAIMAHWCTDEQLKAWVKGVEHAKKQIRAAGFKVEGGEQ